MSLYQRTLRELHQMLVDREISSVELTEDVLGQIDAVDGRTSAYLLVTRELALRQASAADARIKTGASRPLTGIPIAVKDVLCVKDVEATAGSKILKGFVSPYDATVVERLDREVAERHAIKADGEQQHHGPDEEVRRHGEQATGLPDAAQVAVRDQDDEGDRDRHGVRSKARKRRRQGGRAGRHRYGHGEHVVGQQGHPGDLSGQ